MKHILLIILLLPGLSYSMDRDTAKAAYDNAFSEYEKAFKDFIKADADWDLSQADKRKADMKLNQAITKLNKAHADLIGFGADSYQTERLTIMDSVWLFSIKRCFDIFRP